MKKPAPETAQLDTPVDQIAAVPVAAPQTEDVPATGGSYMRLPDGSLRRDEEV